MQRTRWIARLRHLTNSESVISVDEGICVLCSLSPKIQPHGFCAHSFCYFCVANTFAESSEIFICPLCGLELTSMEELKPVSAFFKSSDSSHVKNFDLQIAELNRNAF